MKNVALVNIFFIKSCRPLNKYIVYIDLVVNDIGAIIILDFMHTFLPVMHTITFIHIYDVICLHDPNVSCLYVRNMYWYEVMQCKASFSPEI